MASSFFNNRAHAAAVAGGSSKPEKPVSEAPRLQPWVEKYRPKSLGDVTAQDHTITVLQRTLNATNLPHMLFYGPPGTGKTSTILALAKELYGPELFKSRVLELNASDERGISIVREKVKDFSRQQVSNAPISKEYREKYPCPPFKIIILDESDQMTSDAQSALRRTMETYSRTTRFCLICNYVTRIIDPLASRCSKFRFKPLTGINTGKRLQDIATAEEVKYEDGVIEKLIECSEGDLRRAITYLQSGARMVGAGKLAPVTNGHAGKKGKKSKVVQDDDDMIDVDEPSTAVVTVRSIEEIAGVIPGSVVDKLLDAMSQKRMYDAVAEVVKELVADGWSANQLLTQLYQKIIFNDTIPSRQKNQIVMVFSEMDKRLVDGSDELLSTLDLSLRVAGILAQG